MSALDAFRRERRLFSGEDLAAWLAAAGLTEEEWARRVAAGEVAGLPGPLAPAPSPARATVPRALAEAPPQVWMNTEGGCGDAALRAVCAALGAPAPPPLGPDASLAELVQAATAAGLVARPAKVSRDRAGEVPVPFIAHVDGGHWVVVHAVRADEVIVSDPARGAGAIPWEELHRRWSGWCALFGSVVHCD